MRCTIVSTRDGNTGRSLSAVHLFILFASGLVISCPQRGYSIDLSANLDISHVETSGAIAQINNDKLLIRTEPVSKPRIVINAPDGHWDLQASTKISMLVRNTGASTIRLSCILGDHKWNEGLIILHPDEQGTMEVLIKGIVLNDKHPLKVNFENMNGTPGGYLHHWVKFRADSMSKLTLSLLNNNSNACFEVSEIRGEGNINEFDNAHIQAEYFPLVDSLGQYRHAEWPGKIHSRQELLNIIEIEEKDLKEHPGPPGWDQYGGWLNGPQLEATGHFRVAKWRSKWWLVDPEGRLFWSHGPTGVNHNGAVTRIKGREKYFEALPDNRSVLKQYFTLSGTHQRFNFTAANLHRKYGPDWKTVDFKLTATRLRSWGLNTAANWSDPDLYLNNRTPYTVAIGFGWPKLGGKGKKFPDVFDPGFRQGLTERLKKELETTARDPYCIGYFVDNELNWSGLAWTALVSPPDQHSKQAIVTHLKRSSEQKDRRPNVLLIMCDDLNDYSGAFGGHRQVRTPNIDRLAESGVVFANAQSNCPVCSPSRNSLFTGVYTHKSRDFGWTPHDKQPVLKNCKTLMEYFKENGYLVVGSGKLLHQNRKSLWDEWGVEINNYGPFAYDGKDLVGHPSVPEPFRSIGPVDGSFAPLSDVPTFSKSVGPDKPGWIYSWDKQKHLNYVDQNNRDLTPDEMHAQWAVRKIKELEGRDEKKPFFMGVGFVRPHTPLHAPKRFFDMFPIEEIELSPIKEDDADDCYYTNVYPLSRKGPRYYRLLKESYPDIETGLKHFLQAYLACIAFVDEQIGAVIDALNDSKFRDNTIVVFTSDHGWNMGEKEYLFKNSPWEESTRVPLIIRAPGRSNPESKVDHPVSLIDIYPTLADLCHLEGDTIKSDGGAKIDGYSLRPFLRNPQFRNWAGPDGALTVLGVGANKEDVLEQNYAYRTRNWRYVLYRNGEEELYNHQNDPYEWNNLAADKEYAQKKKELKDQMMSIIRKDLETAEQ